MPIDQAIVDAAIAEAEHSGQPIADLSLDRIARRAGVSRSTMFRRIRSRHALEVAVRAAGVDPGRRPSVRDRAVVAAAELIAEAGIAAFTIEEVARRAQCAMTSVHAQFGGREGLLAAVFERSTPLPVVEQVLADGRPFPSFENGVRAVYAAVFDALADDSGVVEALCAEVLANPGGLVMRFTGEQTVPRIVGVVGGWLTSEIDAGRCRDLPLPLLLPQLIAPVGVHMFVRRRLIDAGVAVPDRDTVIETMTNAFCGAVGIA
ncbi:TetR family transcriptional regulator [Flindersiella endophytica]